ncbi:MAG: 16S rRNA (guanine(966)-N(2))-methyltransferase RsmD [Gammaproteobacteria bacterium]|nr:16S rRNA (guanine(966)-N(2))-methyltransferase RsmD [Gammaproteobacteria bacterium]
MAARKNSDNKKSRQGRLRIVAGNWRSRLLEITDADGLRPTSERIRETLFNWLTGDLYDASCLDLCAGTGALGLEALSRGAAAAVFLEPARDAAKVLRTNIASLEAAGAEVIEMDARDFLKSSRDTVFDIVFIDPPFAAGMHAELCRLLVERGWLADGAKIYLEMDRDGAEFALPGNWQILKDKTAGKVRYMLATPDRSAP